jgi:hypothetical protein
MAKSQIEEIRELEASIGELRETAADIRRTAETVADPDTRAQLLTAATGLEASVELMLAGLRGMRQSIQ